MARKITHGLELSKQSWSALGRNRQLVVFLIISGIGMVVVTILFFIPKALAFRLILETEEPTTVQWIVALAIVFVYYLVASFVVIFANTALVGATLRIIDGQPATVGDAIGIARSRLGKVLVYANSAASAARRNECTGNGLWGIIVVGEAQPTLESNTCADNGQAGLAFFEQAAGVVRENECFGNLIGLHIAETADPELVDNDCHDNTDGDVQDERQ